MAWTIPEQAGGENSAFDGDADIAYALLLADAQWGSTGIINYKAEALILITAILESTVGPQSRLPMLGDWVGFDTSVSFGSAGIGLTHSVIHDIDGPVGVVAQILTIRPKR